MSFRAVTTIAICAAFLLGAPAAHCESPSRKKRIDGYTKYVVRHYGDASAGKALIKSDKGGSCLNCHSVDGKERNAPNLRGIADKFSREDLIRHILDPNLTIRPGYETTIFGLEDGRSLSGNLREVNDESFVVWDSEGKSITILKENVENQRVSNVSLMPDNLIEQISREQLSDLIAYIESLRTKRRKGLAGRDSEVDILKLEPAVRFLPFHDEKVKFDRPVWFEAIPGHANQFVILEHQTAKIWRLQKGEANEDSDRKELFLDLKKEVSHGPNEGLMSIAFHPDFASNGRYFLKHENRDDGKLKTRVIERVASEDRLRDSGNKSRMLFSVDQPAGNHNGGCIRFGPDGFLYIAFGDGGPQRDPNGRSQSPHHLLGSMMRIDVDEQSGDVPYGIPADNPFCDQASKDPKLRREIWATGFREPWRFSFDSENGDLWVGDVGQVKFEEVAIVRRGENHGWNVIEGYEPFSNEYRRKEASYTPPVFAYSHSLGASVTGGHVYRGDPKSSFYGVYIFGDFESRRVWGIKQENGQLTKVRELGRSPIAMSSFGVNNAGEICMVGFDGKIYHVDFSKCNFD